MTSSLIAINVILALAWAAVTGSFAVFNLFVGFVFGLIALWLIREQTATRAYFGRAMAFVELGALFLWELLLSALRVAAIVLRRDMKLSPGVIAYPLTVTRDVEITLLANFITLTPGTLSVDVSEDRKVLFVHCIDVPDEAATIADIRDGFERKILEAFQK